jgi:hypothetical protein
MQTVLKLFQSVLIDELNEYYLQTNPLLVYCYTKQDFDILLPELTALNNVEEIEDRHIKK